MRCYKNSDVAPVMMFCVALGTGLYMAGSFEADMRAGAMFALLVYTGCIASLKK